MSAQFENLASVPNYPGSYIIDRYTNFAFLSAFNDKANPLRARCCTSAPSIRRSSGSAMSSTWRP